ncbi:GNAT family N-acetyltransferase [Rhodoplanes sp. Z2-YC6860]|uniref:GNAT family N-acetyltransferase n=1 Tax=Rhodoplanes sp. Z2-YC6860 TaxID=674703 RepID=UPI00078BD231|nr:N-acetyltransferase [Rhodoplanes sp. Z2-YC6860]AMN39820.1 GCN5-like N-acetyltransferase [Rhodoplanes sp. Z2-YC6860]
MLHIRQEKASEAVAREALLDAAYGPVRFTKPSHRLRAGRAPAQGLSFVATLDDGQKDGQVIGSVRLWEVAVGSDRTALLLGPLAVHPDHRQHGIGGALMRHAMRIAAKRGYAAVLLVGEPAYYGRFGFTAEKTGKLWLPGFSDRSRLLGHEFVSGALDGVRGSIRAPKKPSRTRLIDAVAGLVTLPQPKAA